MANGQTGGTPEWKLIKSSLKPPWPGHPVLLSQVHERFEAVRHGGVHSGEGVRRRRRRVGVEDNVQGRLRVARGQIPAEPGPGK